MYACQEPQIHSSLCMAISMRAVLEEILFFLSIYMLISEMETKYHNISQRIKHNHNYTKNSTMKMLQNTDLIEMQKMILFYQTENGHCTCGQNKL